ncbi:MAG: hypothetical protein AAF203_05865 [Pseudomonadota bacterium]
MIRPSFNRRYLLVFPIFLLFFIFQNCSGVGFQSLEEADAFTVENESLDETPEVPSPPVVEEPPGEILACDDPTFANQNIQGECLALIDIFDRDSVVGGDQFNWTSIIDDVLRDDNANVQATILESGEFGFGEAAAGDGAVYFTGRKGGSVHEIFLISVPLNLSQFNELRIEFNYLPIHLENWSWSGRTGQEHIRLEVCTDSPFECGVNGGSDNHREEALRSSAWRPLFTQDGFGGAGFLADFERGLNNDGRNHLVNSWLDGEGLVDLDDAEVIADKSQVIFRFTIMIDEGFSQKNSDNTPVFTSELIDGMGLDNVRAFAIQK